MTIPIDIIDGLFFQFVLFSIAGWLLEVSFRTIENRRFINPGFNIGPWIPLYGSAAVILSLTVTSVSGYPIYIRALFYLGVTTILEYVTGELLLLLFKKRYWDYSKNFKNIRGFVCPSFSLAWMVAAFVYEILLHPGTVQVISLLSVKTIRFANVTFMAALTLDFTYSSGLQRLSAEWLRSLGGKLNQHLNQNNNLAPAWAFIKKVEGLQNLNRHINFRNNDIRGRIGSLRRRGKTLFADLLQEIQTYIKDGRKK